jgi:hypothetical protein
MVANGTPIAANKCSSFVATLSEAEDSKGFIGGDWRCIGVHWRS